MKTLKESLLTRTKDKVAGTKKNVAALMSIPKSKDWEKQGGSYYLKWDIQHIIDEYGEQYPFLKGYSGITFHFRKIQPLVYIHLVDRGGSGVRYVTTRCYGYEDWGTNITKVKKDTIDFITRISSDEREMNEFIKALYSNEEKDVFGVL